MLSGPLLIFRKENHPKQCRGIPLRRHGFIPLHSFALRTIDHAQGRHEEFEGRQAQEINWLGRDDGKYWDGIN
jgi:hypothetical protein